MTKLLPLLAAFLTIGALATPVLAQDSDQEVEAQNDEEAAAGSSDEEAPAEEAAEEEQSDEAESVADEPEAAASEEESGGESEPAEAEARAEPETSSPAPEASARGVADGTWSGGINPFSGYKALQLTVENSNAATVADGTGEYNVQIHVRGNEVSWSWSVPDVFIGDSMKIDCRGAIEGSALNGICKMGRYGNASMTLTRN